jgi:tetratricopeptide (TPR) repeat protein
MKAVHRVMKAVAATLLLSCGLPASDCVPSHLGEKETLARFQELDRAAQAAFDSGQYGPAVRQYGEAACLVPKSARAFYGLGMAEAAATNFAAARKALETAYALLPGNRMPLAMLVRVNVAMKDIDRVKAVLRTAAQQFPMDADLHSGLARFLAENQLLDLALAESLRFEQTGSSDTASAVALAALENNVGAYGDAIRNGTKIEEQAGVPDSVKASAAGVAGLSYESMGQREEAIGHLKLAIQLGPSEENSYLALAFLYQKGQKFKDAVEVLQQGRSQIPGSLKPGSLNSGSLDSGSLSFLLPLGNNLVWAGQYQPGIDILNQLIRKAPGTAEAYVRLAEAYRNTGRPELETQTLRQLAHIHPDYPMVNVLTARAMMTVNPVDYGAVLAELAQAETRAPADADIFYIRGKVFLAMNRYQEAVTALRRAIALGPLDPGPYYQLGLTYRKLGETELARQTLVRMQHLKPAATALDR